MHIKQSPITQSPPRSTLGTLVDLVTVVSSVYSQASRNFGDTCDFEVTFQSDYPSGVKVSVSDLSTLHVPHRDNLKTDVVDF